MENMQVIRGFNKNIKSLLIEIMQEGKRKNIGIDEITYFSLNYSCYDSQKTFYEKDSKIIQCYDSDSFIKCDCEVDYLQYYGAEFKYDNQKYRLAMYFKDFDHSTGNIHVLPGYLQFWKSESDERLGSFYVYSKETSTPSENRVLGIYKTHSGGYTYHEAGWAPCIEDTRGRDIKMIISDKEIVLKSIWENFPQSACLTSGIEGCDRPINSSQFYSSELKMAIYSKMKNKKSINGRNTYWLLQWRNDLAEDVMHAYYKMIFVEGYGYFCIFDNMEHKLEYHHCNACNFKNITGPNYFDFEKKKWILRYDQK